LGGKGLAVGKLTKTSLLPSSLKPKKGAEGGLNGKIRGNQNLLGGAGGSYEVIVMSDRDVRHGGKRELD